MVAIFFAVALALHAVGHVLFLANSWGYWQTEGAHSSLFTGLGQTAEGFIAILWLLPIVAFLYGTWALVTHQAHAVRSLIAAAALSSIMIFLWWGDLSTGSAFSALLFNLLVVAVMLWRPERLGVPSVR